MTPDVLRYNQFWAMLHALHEEGGHGHAGGVLADWLDDHDSPIRAHIMRNGVPVEAFHDAPEGWGERHAHPHDWITLKGEDRPRFLSGHPGYAVGDPDQPLATHALSPVEAVHLWESRDPTAYPGSRFVVHYVANTPDGHVHTIAPLPSHMLHSIADSFDAAHAGDVQIPWNHWRQAAGHHAWYETHPAQLQRLALSPGTPYGQPFGGGGQIHEHKITDEHGAHMGVIRIQPQYGGTHLHVHWFGRSDAPDAHADANTLGAKALMGLIPQLAEQYPQAQWIKGGRGSVNDGRSGFRGAANAETVSVPIKRKTQLARMHATANGGISNNIFYRGGQFMSRTRKRIRDVASRLVRLSRIPAEYPDFNPLAQAVRNVRAAFTNRENPQPTDRIDPTPSLVLSDWLEEHGIPGAHIVRGKGLGGMTADEQNAANRATGRAIHIAPLVTLSDTPTIFYHPFSGVTGRTVALNAIHGTDPHPVVMASWRRGGTGLNLSVFHRHAGVPLIHQHRVMTTEDLLRAVSDFPQAAKEALLRPLIDDGTLRRVLRGRGKSKTQLARPDEHTYNALIARMVKLREDYASRPDKLPTDRPDPSPHAAFADWLQEHGVPGAHVVAAHAAADSPYTGVLARQEQFLGTSRRAGPIVSLGSNPRYLLGSNAYNHDGSLIGPQTVHDFIAAAGEDPLMQIYWSRTPKRGAGVGVLHHNPNGDRITHVAHVLTPEALRSVIADVPVEARAHLLKTDPDDDELRRAMRSALTGKGSKKVQLARETETPATRASTVFGQDTGRLQYADLKRIEDDHNLPTSKRLSPHVTLNEDGTFGAKVGHIAPFIDHLIKARMPSEKVKRILADPKVSEGVKLTHLVTNIAGEAHDAVHTDWYGEHMNTLDRLLHQRFAGGPDDALWGSLDPSGQLRGKGNPAQHHPATVLFKALIAATSASQNPEKNLLSTIRAWKAGHARALDRGGDTVTHIPLFNVDDLDHWLKATGAPNDPGKTDRERALWAIRYKHDTLPPGYSSGNALVFVHPTDPDHPHHGVVIWKDQNGRKIWNPTRPRTDRTPARPRLIDLPLTNPDGTLRAKGWARYGSQAAVQIAKLKALVAAHRGPNTSVLEAYRAAADWLLTTHSPKQFDAMHKQTRGLIPDAQAVYSGGYYDKTESVPGSFIFGPKFGPFLMNLHSNSPETHTSHGSYLTADKWFTRTFMRHLGRLVTGKKINEHPSAQDRKQMRKAVEQLSGKLGLTVGELQADLWYYEQGLYRMLGADDNFVKSLSYQDAANKYLHPDSPHKLARGDDTEQGFHEALAADPNDATSRMVYADWLDEHGEHTAAKRLRWWAQILPHMPTREQTVKQRPARASDVQLPVWAGHLAIHHFQHRDTVSRPDLYDPHGELRALGLMPRDTRPMYGPHFWHVVSVQRDNLRMHRTTHALAAQTIARRLGLETPS